MMYRMNTRYTNNQAEAFAILKALEYVHTKLDNEVDKVTTVHTDSMMTLESLNNMYKHTFLTEEIRRKVQEIGAEGGQHDSGGQKPTWGPLVTNWPTR